MTDNPQPGPGLDTAIARLMGWKTDRIIPLIGPSYDVYVSPDGEIHNEITPWSTDDATAMAALQQLCKSVEKGGRGWDSWCLSYDRFYDGSEIYDVSEVSRNKVQRTSKISLAHAAALAMKAALEAEK